MSVPDRRSRFAGNSKPGQGGNSGPTPVRITEHLFAFAQVTARKGRENEVAAALKQHLGFDLPFCCRVSGTDRHAAIWLQPNGWLLRGPASGEAAFARELDAALAGSASIVDQSHGRAVLRISGIHARDVLAKCCRLDFHPRAFAIGHSASTTIAHVSCTIHQVDDAPTYELVVGSTFAAWLLDELTDASADFGWRFERARSETSA